MTFQKLLLSHRGKSLSIVLILFSKLHDRPYLNCITLLLMNLLNPVKKLSFLSSADSVCHCATHVYCKTRAFSLHTFSLISPSKSFHSFKFHYLMAVLFYIITKVTFLEAFNFHVSLAEIAKHLLLSLSYILYSSDTVSFECSRKNVK